MRAGARVADRLAASPHIAVGEAAVASGLDGACAAGLPGRLAGAGALEGAPRDGDRVPYVAPGTLRALLGKDGKRTPIRGDGAHGSRKNFAAVRMAGYRPRAPIRTADSGRSGGTEGWHEEAALQLAGVRGAASRGP